MGESEFAVVDLETTGFRAEGSDRIVEIAVVVLDGRGEIRERWETLVNPKRDLGPQEIHRIRGSDVIGAPTFEQIAGDLVSLLRGRILAAHNASFERRFLSAEMARAGIRPPPLAEATLCTMRLAGELLPVASRSLASCCAACGIELRDAHRASADAIATAQLLSRWLREKPHAPWWRQLAARARALAWPAVPKQNVALVTREMGGERKPHFLERIADRLPPHAGPAAETEYLALLDRCLLDRRLSVHEADALVELATELGIARSQCARLHEIYFDQLVRLAWEDGRLSPAEREEIGAVAQLLALPREKLASALEAPPEGNAAPALAGIALGSFRLEPNDRIVLTGATRRSREEWLAEIEAVGLIPANSVSRKVKLLVAADPDSLSGKAQKARELGIPIVDEEGFVALLNAYQATRRG